MYHLFYDQYPNKHACHTWFFHEQLGDLRLEELLETAPPGLDEVLAISKASKINYFFNKSF